MHDGVVHLGPRHVDPAHDVGVDGTQRVPVHRQVRKRRARDVLRRVEGLFRQRIVGVLALPVGKRDGAERRQGEHEHHEGHPEDDAPGAAPLPAPAFLGIWGMRPCAPGLPPRPRPLVCTGRTAPVRACGAFAAGPDLMRLRGAGSRPGLPRPRPASLAPEPCRRTEGRAGQSGGVVPRCWRSSAMSAFQNLLGHAAQKGPHVAARCRESPTIINKRPRKGGAMRIDYANSTVRGSTTRTCVISSASRR